MHFFSACWLLASLSVAAPLLPTNGACMNPQLRREWRQLGSNERHSYIKAVRCLVTRPSRLGLESSLYDDFAFVHNKLNLEIHSVASFLPWHRYFVHIYESALHSCGYTGSATYWDWSLDSGNTSASPIWSARDGLGGNGSPSKSMILEGFTVDCVADGPFQDLKPQYYNDNRSPHCLMRSFNSGTEGGVGGMLGSNYAPAAVAAVQRITRYDEYRKALESGPHRSVHTSIGGDFSPSTSPNDPLFFLHHTQIDRLWWLWQQRYPAVRNWEYGGMKTQDRGDGTAPEAASARDILRMMDLAPDALVMDYLTTESQLLCYRY